MATGFLALGPKVLAEVDETKMEMDIVDEQVDTVGRAFLGLTLGCARCHDHKFDPISIDDYYALAGIFKSTKTMEHFKKLARWHEYPLDGKLDAKKEGPSAMGVAEGENHRCADPPARQPSETGAGGAAARAENRLGPGAAVVFRQAERPAGTGPLAHSPRTSADEPGHGESALALAFRPRHCAHHG